MQINVTLRHLDDSNDVQDYAKEKVKKLERYLSNIEKIEIVLSNGRETKTAELIVTPRRGANIVGSVSDKDIRAAINLAVGKMERQLTKLKEKVKEHRSVKPVRQSE